MALPIIEEPKNLTEVFSEFHERLATIKRGNNYYNGHNVYDEDFQILKIQRYIGLFPNQAVVFIDAALAEIKELKEKGTGILDKSHFSLDWEFSIPDPFPDDTTRYANTEELKSKIYILLQQELNFYQEKLAIIRKKFQSLNVDSDSLVLTDQKFGTSATPTVISIDENFKLVNLKILAGVLKLNIYQSALLFHYLQAANIIYGYEPQALGRIVAVLTGHSEQNLRTACFPLMKNIKSNKDNKTGRIKAGGKNLHLNAVKLALEEILKSIDKDVQANM